MKVRVTYEETSRTTFQHEVDDAEFDAWLAERDEVRPDGAWSPLGYFVHLFLEDSLAGSDALVNELDIERRRQGVARAFTDLNVVGVQVQAEAPAADRGAS